MKFIHRLSLFVIVALVALPLVSLVFVLTLASYNHSLFARYDCGNYALCDR